MIDLPDLIAALSRPEAYPHPVDAVEMHQTHISVVFLAGPFAYKIKKPVNLGFLDFSTLEKRKHFCEEEVRLNRRLAPQVYLGVAAIASDAETLAKITPALAASSSSVIEWAVQMRRLPADATLESRLDRNEVTPEQIRALAERVASFHRDAESSEHISSFGRCAVVAGNARENFTQCAGQVGQTVSSAVFERVRDLTEARLACQRELIEARASHGVPRDTHGDLHLDHVYAILDEKPPNDLVIIDCIEFADRFRYADPVADMAFLTMDLAFHGRRDLASTFADAYFAASYDPGGRDLLAFYVAYRAMVRAKVEGMKAREQEIDAEERALTLQQARAHWLLALGELETPAARPALVLIAGLPGCGKSTLARTLAERARFDVLRSDVVRKELAADSGEDIYTPAWTERTYVELLQRAEAIFWQGGRVVVDANFRGDAWRRRFLDAARRWGVRVRFILCRADHQVVKQRLQARHNDASDADWRVYRELEASWEPLSDDVRHVCLELDTSPAAEVSGAKAIDALAADGIDEP